jgi:hypothetical protein
MTYDARAATEIKTRLNFIFKIGVLNEIGARDSADDERIWMSDSR